MTAEADEPRKRRKYTTAERLAILKTADKDGPVEVYCLGWNLTVRPP